MIHYVILMFTAWPPKDILFIEQSTNKLINVYVVYKLCVNVIIGVSFCLLILLAGFCD
jgi:hypothetical protein